MWEKGLTRAIRDRAVVEFRYHGEARTVEPYRLGLADGRALLMGWQARKGWRTFDLGGIEDLDVTERTFFSPREGFARGDARLDRILAEV